MGLVLSCENVVSVRESGVVLRVSIEFSWERVVFCVGVSDPEAVFSVTADCDPVLGCLHLSSRTCKTPTTPTRGRGGKCDPNC